MSKFIPIGAQRMEERKQLFRRARKQAAGKATVDLQASKLAPGTIVSEAPALVLPKGEK